jgi:hypothetical protein
MLFLYLPDRMYGVTAYLPQARQKCVLETLHSSRVQPVSRFSAEMSLNTAEPHPHPLYSRKTYLGQQALW